MKPSRFHRTQVLVVGLSLAVLATIALPIRLPGMGAAPVAPDLQVQTAKETPPDFKYDVVSIKPAGSVPYQRNQLFSGAWEPDGIVIRRAALASLILAAYTTIDPNASVFGLRDEQLFGAPSWAYSERYSIDAKMDASVADQLSKLGPDQEEVTRNRMLRAILEDRFKLKVHVENREGQVYFLIIAKNGPKFKDAKPGEKYPRGTYGPAWEAGSVVMAPPEAGSAKRIGLGAPIDQLTMSLSMWLHTPVVDKTGLTGKYDFQIQWTADESATTGPAADWPPLFTAIQQQLGLKLESGKGPIPVLVIDHAEKPSGN